MPRCHSVQIGDGPARVRRGSSARTKKVLDERHENAWLVRSRRPRTHYRSCLLRSQCSTATAHLDPCRLFQHLGFWWERGTSCTPFFASRALPRAMVQKEPGFHIRYGCPQQRSMQTLKASESCKGVDRREKNPRRQSRGRSPTNPFLFLAPSVVIGDLTNVEARRSTRQPLQCMTSLF